MSNASGLFIERHTTDTALVLISVVSAQLVNAAEEVQVVKPESTLSIDLDISGAGGVDAGVRTAKTWYYVWLIANSSGSGPVCMASTSTSLTGLVWPDGYETGGYGARLGSFVTTASGDIVPYSQAGQYVHYDGAQRVMLQAQGTTSWTLSTTAPFFAYPTVHDRIPPTSRRGYFDIMMVGSPGDGIAIRRPALFSELAWNATYRVAASGLTSSMVWCNTDERQRIEFKTTRSTNSYCHIDVMGYVEY